MTIRRLPQELARLIAAGEVVERPWSVVKELVENSLDAGAKRIDIDLVAGGKTLIAVKDDGCGIPADQLALAVEKHATSKIAAVEDLEAISSLGYRGEALASVGAVAGLELFSRAEGAPEGAHLVMTSAGVTVQPLSLERGTTVKVTDLFYNLPARRKFLKSPVSETKRIAELVRDYSVSRPDVSFRLHHEGRRVYQSAGTGNRADVLKNWWGSDPEPLCRKGSDDCGTAELWWQDTGPASRLSVTTFINGRRVTDKSLRAALLSHPWAGRGNWFVSLTLPYADLDVNIHPTKSEVLLRRAGDVFALVRAVAGLFAGEKTQLPAGALAFRPQRPLTAGYQDRLPSPFEESAPRVARPAPLPSVSSTDLPWERTLSSPSSPSEAPRASVWAESAAAPQEPFSLPLLSEQERPSALYMGQTPQGYLIFADDKGLLLIDPHAAHERVNYERLVSLWKDAPPAAQPLAAPIPVPPTLAEDLEGHEDALAGLGFVFQEGSLSAVPSVPFDIQPLRLLRGALAALVEGGPQADLLDHFATRACKASIKLTTRLTASEALSLYAQLEGCEESRACPHGRPVTLRLTTKTLDDHFGRNGL